MSIETLLCGIGIMQVIIMILLILIAAIANSAEGKANGMFGIAADVTRQLDIIIRQNSVEPTSAPPAPKQAKVAKVPPTYQPKRNRA